MKRAVLLLGLVVCSLQGTTSFAQVDAERREEKYLRVPHRFQIFMDGAIAMPTDPGLFNDYWNTAFQFGIGGGMVIFPWLEVNASYSYSSFNNNSIASKEKLEYQGVPAVEGGTIYTSMYYGSARFVGVPKQRTNPFLEFGVGAFTTKADDIVIEGVLQNSMKSVSGMCVVPSVGIQYAMNERWGAYTKYTYAVNLNQDFAPGDLLLPAGETQPTRGGNQVISSIGVGLIAKF
jgi:opacity protein-like surface antigen